MIYLNLFYIFLKIGFFSFGGGLATLPLIEQEVLIHHWLTEKQFLDIVAVSQITPGPISTNVATYIGTQQAGFLGGLVATIGVSFASFAVILLLFPLFYRLKENVFRKAFFYALIPITIALILFSGILIAGNSFSSTGKLNFSSIFLFVFCALLLKFTKISSIILIVISALLGILFY